MGNGLRLAVIAALAAFVGASLLLSDVRWFRRQRLVDRLAPFAGPGPLIRSRQRTFGELLGPFVARGGARASRVLGLQDDLALRLRRGGSSLDPTAFRTRQAAASGGALGLATLLVAIGDGALPLPMTALLVIGTPVLAFLVIEQRSVQASQQRQKRLFAELPVIAEQLAMLLGAGYSVGAALNRIADRTGSVAGEHLRTVRERVGLGLSTTDALREWAELADLPELHRLVAVLALGGETSDLGRLVSVEAAAIRREAQRRLLETIDRRNQQVWVPVTVATLVPGVTFLVIPFLQALNLFAAT